ncbi:lipid droplet-associated protein [Pseudonocardia eucalypti]
MKPLPMPIRIAAGLVVTALEEAQELPRKITEFPVTAVSQALQASMRLQQRVTELAIKGDRALGSLRPVPEAPEWARFDEDEDDAGDSRFFGSEHGRPNGLANGLRAPLSTPPKVTPVRILPDPDEDDAAEALPSPRPPTEASDLPAVQPDAKPASKPTAPARAERRKAERQKADPSKTEPSKTEPSKTEPSKVGRQKVEPEKAAKAEKSAGGPSGLEEYEQWSLPQLRARFRNLTLPQLEALLAWETGHQDRPPYVTMLSNRIASVSGR